MRRKKLHALFALLLAFCLVLAGCDNFGGQESGPSERRARRTIPYEDMEYERPDVEDMIDHLEELTAAIEEAGSFEELLELDAEASAVSEEFSTMATLANLHYYQDVTDSYYDEENRYCTEMGISLSNALNDLNRAILEGPYAKEYRNYVGDYIYKSIEDSLLLNSPEVEPLKQKREELANDYTTEITKRGVNIDNAAEHADYFTDLYRQIVELDEEIAFLLGFGSAAEMYYLSYSRDYDADDILVLYEDIKEYFVPMMNDVIMVLWEYYSQDEWEMPLQEYMDEMPDILGVMDPELKEAWAFMVDYDLFDFAPSANKGPHQFCTTIPGYDAPYIFGQWDDSVHSAITLTHEFGHFYDMWLRYDSGVVFNLDIAETYSQGLEFLLQDFFSDFADDPELLIRGEVAGAVINIFCYQAVLDEFSMRSYSMDSFDAKQLARLYSEVNGEFGLDFASVDGGAEDYSWILVPHLFSSPFYVPSYITSALTAMQIWALAQENWNEAMDLYLAMIHADQNQPFQSLVESVGLMSPFDADAVPFVADAIAAYLGLDNRSRQAA